VKYGAYSIVGVDTIVTVYKGQTLKGISKAYLGSGMECYVEAFNETKEVKPGDKVRIPKLKVKKRSKK
jgi:nucleoid-associated protein YgaU